MNSTLFASLFVLISTSLSFNPAAWAIEPGAAPLGEVFEQLKDSGENYEITGTVCEQVARLELQRDYPAPRYEVLTGVAYAEARRVIGELDVVVFDKSAAADGKAVLIAEVKCWKNLPGGSRKARQQRKRFLDTMEQNQKVDFYLVSKREVQFERDQFQQAKRFISISQNGGHQAGFEDCLPYTLEELMALRERLMKCQNQGECRRAN
jgi:hypothetical protein